jgi:hypothetical protein
MIRKRICPQRHPPSQGSFQSSDIRQSLYASRATLYFSVHSFPKTGRRHSVEFHSVYALLGQRR